MADSANTDADIRQIRDMLGQLCAGLRDLSANQREHSTEQRLLKEDVAQIKHVLIEGNGQPAMTVRLALLENEQKRITEERNDRKLPRSAWVAIVISAIFSIAGIALTVAAMV